MALNMIQVIIGEILFYYMQSLQIASEKAFVFTKSKLMGALSYLIIISLSGIAITLNF